MRVRFFQYQIYRRRFFLAVVMVLLFSIILLIGILSFFVNSWVDNQHGEAQRSFEDIVSRVQREEGRAEDFVWEIYSSSPLMDDTAAFFLAQDTQGYIQLRGENSRNSSVQIASFPAYLRTLLNGREGYVTDAVVTSYDGADKHLRLDEAGNLEIAYGTAMDAEIQDGWLLGDYPVRRSARLEEVIGTVSFWVKGDELFATRHAYIGEYGVIDAQGRLWGSQYQDQHAGDGWLQQAANQEQPSGSFFDGWNWVFYSVQEEPLQRFSYVTAVDLWTLLSVNANMIWMLIAAMALLDLAVISFIYWNTHYDSVFLGYLLGIIERVEKGDFKGVEALPRPKFQGKDEYGLISTALESMSHALDEYILMEYRMKIKQQETAMRALEQQINPHFLYNTLEAIRAKALLEHNPQTAESIALLGGLYRDMVQKGSELLFAEEKELLEKYLKIMQLRYPDSFMYQVTFEPELLKVKTLKFWLQPLAENFFSHGFDRNSEYNVLVVTGEAEGNGWRIRVMDNGAGIPEENLQAVNERMRSGDDHSGHSIGLRNVYMRLAYYYGRGFSMEARNNPEGGACISIYIPNKEASDCIPC
ncbi:MAG TPA: histidine kinase [Firmicutes bacterium]|nr:histidine kinase [Bacillota bacterium]